MAAVTAFSEHAEKVRQAIEDWVPSGHTPTALLPLDAMVRLYEQAEKQKLDAIEAAADFEARAVRAEAALATARKLVDEQAEDEGLWGIHPTGEQPVVEAYLQQELRRLHAAVEGVSQEDAARCCGAFPECSHVLAYIEDNRPDLKRSVSR